MRTVEEWLGKDNQLAIDIWNKKYKFEDETFEEWLDRVSGGNEDLKELIINKKFLFGGRILANRGLQHRGRKVTFSNCYVLSTGDSIEEIYKTCSDLARTFSYGGGCGLDITPLRPKDALVNNAAKKTSGAVSFMETFSQVTETIGQNGRRGALMLSISCEHPEIEEFIDIKTDLDKVTKANISIRMTDEFMKAVCNKEMYTCEFELANGEVITKEVDATRLFNRLAENNWRMGEPGILFWDSIENYNLMSEDEDFKYAGVNPCAEEPLPNGGSCLLGSFNLSAYVNDGEFCFYEFKNDIYTVVKAMNDVLDEGLPLHPLQIQKDTVRDLRQIGIGIMGIADMLIKMGIKYDSDNALMLCDDIGYMLANESIKASALLAKEFGAFPKCKIDKILESEYFLNNADDEAHELVCEYGLRNSQILTIAPTGTLSTMLGISGGIEPIFNLSYNRLTKSLHGEDVVYKVFTPIVKEYMERYGLEDEEDLPDFFVTAQTINPFMRVKIQGIWQRHIDASISSTINLPNETTVELVENLYKAAWKEGLKGLTIFRDGCERVAILTSGTDKKEEEKVKELKRGEWKSLADDTYYIKRSLKIGCGKLKLFIGYSPSENAIQDLYIVKSGQGGCEKNLQSIAIAISALLRVGGSLDQLKQAFSGITPCPSFIASRAKGIPLSTGNYCGMAIINEVEKFLKEIEGQEKVEVKQEKKIEKVEVKHEKAKCPECGERTLISTGGCDVCSSCGYSHCG